MKTSKRCRTDSKLRFYERSRHIDEGLNLNLPKDTETKRQSSVRVFPRQTPPLKVKTPRSVRRKMLATFFSSSGQVAMVALEIQRTAAAQQCTTVCLPAIPEKIGRGDQDPI